MKYLLHTITGKVFEIECEAVGTSITSPTLFAFLDKDNVPFFHIPVSQVAFVQKEMSAVVEIDNGGNRLRRAVEL